VGERTKIMSGHLQAVRFYNSTPMMFRTTSVALRLYSKECSIPRERHYSLVLVSQIPGIRGIYLGVHTWEEAFDSRGTGYGPNTLPTPFFTAPVRNWLPIPDMPRFHAPLATLFAHFCFASRSLEVTNASVSVR